VTLVIQYSVLKMKILIYWSRSNSWIYFFNTFYIMLIYLLLYAEQPTINQSINQSKFQHQFWLDDYGCFILLYSTISTIVNTSCVNHNQFSRWAQVLPPKTSKTLFKMKGTEQLVQLKLWVNGFFLTHLAPVHQYPVKYDYLQGVFRFIKGSF
jgi:hypothetical protein